jgi:putative protease
MRKRPPAVEIQFYCTARSPYQIKWIRDVWDAPVFAPAPAIEEYKARACGDLRNIGLLCDTIATDGEMSKTAAFLGRNGGVRDILIGNIGYLSPGFKGKYNIYGDFPLNVTNSLAAEFYEDEGLCGITASVEANIRNVKNIMTRKIPLSAVGYGKIPLMVTECCLKSSITRKCQRERRPFLLRDQKGEEFMVECESGCRNSVYNPYPIMMADKLPDIMAAGINRVCLRFHDENRAQVEEIIRSFKLGQNPLSKFTRGHFYRGAY